MRLPRLLAILAVLHAAIPAGTGSAAEHRQPLTVTTQAGAREFQVEIADDPQERTKGLMFRRSMGNDEGMLFDFGTEQPVGFWMKNTYIPLDMLFIREDGTIESIAERTTPLSERTVPSRGEVRYVLEINGGLSDQLGIRPGDKVSGPALASAR